MAYYFEIDPRHIVMRPSKNVLVSSNELYETTFELALNPDSDTDTVFQIRVINLYLFVELKGRIVVLSIVIRSKLCSGFL